MSGTRGYFKGGKWIEEAEPEPEEEKKQKAEEKIPIEDLMDKTSESVNTAIKDVLNLANTLLGTKEGREHIEKKVRKAEDRLNKAIDEIAEDVKKRMK